MIEKNKTKIKCCTACPLFKNQLPLLDNFSNSDVFWVGLSARSINKNNIIPLDKNTNSGKVIFQIENDFKKVKFYKTNLVKCLPLNCQKKLRYPTGEEKSACFKNLLLEVDSLKPKLIFLLGNEVSHCVSKTLNFNVKKLNNQYKYKYQIHKNVFYVPIHHPSYIFIYKRKCLEQYINGVRDLIKKFV